MLLCWPYLGSTEEVFAFLEDFLDLFLESQKQISELSEIPNGQSFFPLTGAAVYSNLPPVYFTTL